jgi:hypothetical protein
MSCDLAVQGASLRAIRDEIEAVFGDLLGVYFLPSGSTIPALWVRGFPSAVTLELGLNPNQLRPDWRADGIEAILENPPELDRVGTGAVTRRTWTLTFTQWDTRRTLAEAVIRAHRAYPSARKRHQRQTADTYERLIVELLDHVLIQPL